MGCGPQRIAVRLRISVTLPSRARIMQRLELFDGLGTGGTIAMTGAAAGATPTGSRRRMGACAGRVTGAAPITGAGATGAAAICDREGGKPQICLRSREIRGIQSVEAPCPVRMNAQPVLSTYCSEVNDWGGNSAGGLRFCAIPCPETATIEDRTVAANPMLPQNFTAFLTIQAPELGQECINI